MTLIGDANTGDNSETRIDVVKSSYDPNFIAVKPVRCFKNDTELEYTIHFENTGNDTAYNIHIVDTLSGNLDEKSLKIILSSAKMNIAIYQDGPFKIVKFDFPNIKLPDSSHHNLNDGAVFFSIKTRPGLADGSTIQNHAGIYFDDNEVVITNTVTNEKGCVEVIVPYMNNNNEVELYPNPTSNELTIKMEAGAYGSFTITNNVGQQLIQERLHSASSTINVKSLVPGVYYIMLRGDNGIVVKKFIKM